MFEFFIDLYYAIVEGSWTSHTSASVLTSAKSTFDSLPLWNMFNNSVDVASSIDVSGVHSLISVILSSICCISLFLFICYALKRLFSVFLGKQFVI